LRSTVKNPDNTLQKFVVEINAYGQTSYLVHKAKSIQSKRLEEAPTAQKIINELAKTVVFLH
jgi:hypothetical protein